MLENNELRRLMRKLNISLSYLIEKHLYTSRKSSLNKPCLSLHDPQAPSVFSEQMLAMQVLNSKKQVSNYRTEYEALKQQMLKKGSIEDLEKQLHAMDVRIKDQQGV